jgi:hypothetical protein
MAQSIMPVKDSFILYVNFTITKIGLFFQLEDRPSFAFNGLGTEVVGLFGMKEVGAGRIARGPASS